MDGIFPFWLVIFGAAPQHFLSGAKSIAYTLNRGAN
jgi:hypothetical protein